MDLALALVDAVALIWADLWLSVLAFTPVVVLVFGLIYSAGEIPSPAEALRDTQPRES